MLLAYNYLQSGLFKEAIAAAEALAKADIRASQAPMAAAYAMQAYAQYMAEREQKVASKDDLKPERDKMLEFAKFAEGAWPNDLPANLARHQVGMMLLREQNLGEAIKKLNTVTPAYPNYALVKYQIADVCLLAEKEKREPLKEPAGLGSYADIAMKALAGIPDNTLGGGDPTMNHVYFMSRIRMGQEYFKQKKYTEMEKLVEPLIKKVETVSPWPLKPTATFSCKDITASLKDISMYGKLGLADVQFKDKHYDKVLELVEPIVVDINADKLPQLKTNPQLSANALLSMALKSSMQLNNLDKTKNSPGRHAQGGRRRRQHRHAAATDRSDPKPSRRPAKEGRQGHAGADEESVQAASKRDGQDAKTRRHRKSRICWPGITPASTSTRRRATCLKRSRRRWPPA